MKKWGHLTNTENNGKDLPLDNISIDKNTGLIKDQEEDSSNSEKSLKNQNLKVNVYLLPFVPSVSLQDDLFFL